MRVVVCAATGAEHEAVAAGIADAGAAGSLEVLLTGVGPAHAKRALSEHLDRGGPRVDLVVSTGFAGARDRSLARMSWVTATKVRGVDGVTLREAPSPAARCEIVSSAELVDVRSESAGVAVDMESAALAEVAARHSVPFMVLRLVSDTPDAPLPNFLTPFAASMAADDARSKLKLAARGLRAALVDPKGVVTVVKEGREWTRALREGWSRFAKLVG